MDGVAMEHFYSQLSEQERVQIFHLHANGMSARGIGRRIGRHHGTISRELLRNSKATKRYAGGYEPVRAHGLALRRRRWDCRFKLVRQPDLQAFVKQRLAMEQSPEQIAGRLALKGGSMRISHESIYRFIEHRIRSEDYSWHKLLPRAKFYRGRRPKKGGPPSRTFTDYVSIDHRPADVASRETYGHWEADLMAFRHNTEVILVAHERKSRMKFAWTQPNKGAEAVRLKMCEHLLSLPQSLRGSITYDNGTEFAQHHLINKATGTKSYFCHTHSPWQKGGVENAIGRMRRYLPRKTKISEMPQCEINAITERHNNTPRKCLGYLTPMEVWTKCLKSSTVALQP
jgi:transposase, IS30 family